MARTRIFRIEPVGRYGLFAYPTGAHAHPSVLGPRGRPIGPVWRGPSLIFDQRRIRSGAALDMGDCAGGYAFRADFLDALRLRAGPDLELLQLRVEDQDWWLVNALYTTTSFDPDTSRAIALAPIVPDAYDFKWVNTTDTRARVAEIFYLNRAVNGPVVAESLVARIKSAGIKGMRFEHVGYIVDDLSEAVPPPPPKPPKPSKARKVTTLTLHALPRGEATEVRTHLVAWLAAHGLPPKPGGDAVLTAIGAQIGAARISTPGRSGDDWIALLGGLGAAYGDLICRTLGWHWAELRQGRDLAWVAVSPPERTHALALAPFMRRQIEAPASTHELLFNMLKAGHLPPAQEGTVVTIG